MGEAWAALKGDEGVWLAALFPALSPLCWAGKYSHARVLRVQRAPPTVLGISTVLITCTALLSAGNVGEGQGRTLLAKLKRAGVRVEAGAGVPHRGTGWGWLLHFMLLGPQLCMLVSAATPEPGAVNEQGQMGAQTAASASNGSRSLSSQSSSSLGSRLCSPLRAM